MDYAGYAKVPPANAGALLPSWAAYSTLACLSRQKLIGGIESIAGENREPALTSPTLCCGPWAVGKSLTHILLVDPKGQSGIHNWESLKDVNAKVALAHSGVLPELALALGRGTTRRVKVDSFILLRKSSPLGKPNGSLYDPKVITDMEGKHVLHLHWAPEVNGRRVDEDGDKLPPPPDERCYVERMLACAGLIKTY